MSIPFNYSPLLRFEGHRASIYSLEKAKHNLHFFSAGGDRMITQWDIEQPEKGTVLALASAAVYSLRYLPETDLLLAGNAEGILHCISCDERKEIRQINVFKSPVFSIQQHVDSPCLALTSGEGHCMLMDKKDFKVIAYYPVSSVKLRSATFHPSGQLLALGDAAGRIFILDLNTNKIIHTYQAHQEGFGVNCLLFSDDGHYLYSGGRDAHLNLSHWLSGEILKRVPAHNYAIYSLLYLDPAHRYLVTASRDRSLKVWSHAELEFLVRPGAVESGGHTFSVNTLLCLQDGNWIISAGDDKKIIAWNANGRTEDERIPLHYASTGS